MTKKDIEDIIKTICTDDEDFEKPCISPMYLRKELEALALEQEAVLDKIKAEIWDLQYGDEEKSMTDEDRADGYNNAIIQAIEIIDKYRTDRSDDYD